MTYLATYFELRQGLNQMIKELGDLQGGKMLYGLFKASASRSEHRDLSQIEKLFGPFFDPLAETKRKFTGWSIQADVYIGQFGKAPIVRSFVSTKTKVQRALDSKKPDVKSLASKMEQMGIQLDGINLIAHTLVKQEKPKLPKPASRLISPDSPFSNKMAFWDTIRSCDEQLSWVDKYFSVAGLRMLSEALDRSSVKSVKILTSIDKADDGLKKLFKDFRDELASAGVRCELRVIIDSSLKSSIHDRWIISKSKCFNVPSPDTIERGQFSEIKETANRPPFDDWWDKSVDIVEGWNDIQKAKEGIKKS